MLLWSGYLMQSHYGNKVSVKKHKLKGSLLPTHWDKSVKMIGHVLLKICITWRSKIHGNGPLHFYPHQSSISLLRMTSVCVASLNYSSPCPRPIFSQTVGKHFFCFESVTCCMFMQEPFDKPLGLLTPVLSVCRLQYLC